MAWAHLVVVGVNKLDHVHIKKDAFKFQISRVCVDTVILLLYHARLIEYLKRKKKVVVVNFSGQKVDSFFVIPVTNILLGSKSSRYSSSSILRTRVRC